MCVSRSRSGKGDGENHRESGAERRWNDFVYIFIICIAAAISFALLAQVKLGKAGYFCKK